MKKTQRYHPILRFLLMDDKKRLFSIFRWCFRGAIDGWYPLDCTKPVDKLASTYVKHIGESCSSFAGLPQEPTPNPSSAGLPAGTKSRR